MRGNLTLVQSSSTHNTHHFPLCNRADLRRTMGPKEAKPKQAARKHAWVKVGWGQHQCLHCFAKAGTQPPLARCRRAGKESLRESFGRMGHRLACYAAEGGGEDGQLFFVCISCGFYGGAKAKKLCDPCPCRSWSRGDQPAMPAAPMGAGGRRTISRLLRGLHPTKDIRARHVHGPMPVGGRR